MSSNQLQAHALEAADRELRAIYAACGSTLLADRTLELIRMALASDVQRPTSGSTAARSDVLRVRLDSIIDTVNTWNTMARAKGFQCVADALTSLPDRAPASALPITANGDSRG